MRVSCSRRDFVQKAGWAGFGLVAMGVCGACASPPAEKARSGKPFRIRTLGTGASDHDWARLGEPGVRGSASTLIDGHILVDCGTTGCANLERAGVAFHALTDLVITHSHGDHFQVGEIRKVIGGRKPEQAPLSVWADPRCLAALERQGVGPLAGHALAPGTVFEVGRCRVTALPANHPVAEPERALHYLFETPCGNLLYALDGAWMLKQARQLIGKRRLDMIVWDATMSKTGDYRIFEHCDLAMIGLMMESLRATGAADDQTVCVLDHVARTLWPADLREAKKLAAARGWILAADGMALELRAT